ncbi:heme NO-binding domain-containing protein [Aliiroseovarius sp. PTFE2010]|uniref:heme NO-binding domain-containing protein n=1 Tax=Aliiroseovarius sp. PTFE2010 TaxID=3417190 RepID=UPI003CE7CB44
MHGLINRSIQCFLRDTYGVNTWAAISEDAQLGHDNFEAMLIYEDAQSFAMLDAASAQLRKPQDALLEDLGTYLVSHPNREALRRLLRFGGETFEEFLHSLDELQDRARLAVPEMDLPSIEVDEVTAGAFSVKCGPGMPGFGYVMVGVLRAMADDYGALVLLEHQGEIDGSDCIGVSLLEAAFAEGRSFDLAAKATQ